MHICNFKSPFFKKVLNVLNRVCVYQSCLKICLLKCSSGLGAWFSGRNLDYHAQGSRFNSQYHGGGSYEPWAVCIFDYFHIYVAKGVFSKVCKSKIIVGKVTIIACFQPWVKTRPAWRMSDFREVKVFQAESIFCTQKANPLTNPLLDETLGLKIFIKL